MSRWFRHYAGMMRDDKLVRVALRSKQSIERVCWVWGAILESAAEIDEDGRYDVDAAEVAYFLRTDESDVDAILGALADAGRVAANSVVKWGNRQFQSDRSKERVAAHRERKRSERAVGDGEQAPRNADVTLQDANGNAPETETELDTEEVSEASPHIARAPRQPLSEAQSSWNESAVVAGWPTISTLSTNRSRQLSARLRSVGLEGWKAALLRARASPYLGRDPPSWFTFDWAIKDTNFLKLTEGNYDKRCETDRGGARQLGGPPPDPTLALVRSAIAAQR